MDHLSLFWVYPDREKHLKAIETDFFQRIYRTIKEGTISLPPHPQIIIELQGMCKAPTLPLHEIAHLLLDDVPLTWAVIRSANSPLFASKGHPPCYDIHLALSRIGTQGLQEIIRVHQGGLDFPCAKECSTLLQTTAQLSREFASTMALLCKKLKSYDKDAHHLDVEKALLIGLLADIGIYSVINAYRIYCEEGNYLDFEIARHIFWRVNKETSHYILKNWDFDQDFINVASEHPVHRLEEKINYFDIAKMANHLLMFRNKDKNIHEHEIELTLAGAETMYELTNLKDAEFQKQLHDVTHHCHF